MYGWIWRKLPFGLPGKLIGMVLLATTAAALLWFYAFPALTPLLPFNQSTIGEEQPGGDEQEPEPGDGGGEEEDGVPSHDPSDFELEDSPEPSE